MMTVEQVRDLDKRSDTTKLLPTTITFLKEMRAEANSGRKRQGKSPVPWRETDEARY